MRPLRPRRAGARLGRLLPLALAALVGCSDAPAEGTGPTISRDRFIEVVVDLRRAAYRYPDGILRPGDAEEVLERHGITVEDLDAFVERYAGDVPRMAEIWAEIQAQTSAILAGAAEATGGA